MSIDDSSEIQEKPSEINLTRLLIHNVHSYSLFHFFEIRATLEFSRFQHHQ